MNRVLFTAVMTSVIAGSTFADTWYVSQGESIQAAIDASSNGDTISIEAGTYYESGISTNGKEIIISGATNAKGFPAVTIDGQGAGTVLVCNSVETALTVIENLKITNGSALNGGGMYVEFSNPTLTNCTFVSNNATACAADLNGDGEVKVDDLLILIAAWGACP